MAASLRSYLQFNISMLKVKYRAKVHSLQHHGYRLNLQSSVKIEQIHPKTSRPIHFQSEHKQTTSQKVVKACCVVTNWFKNIIQTF